MTFGSKLSLPQPKAPKLPKERGADKPEPIAESAARREQRKGFEEVADLASLGFLGYS